MNSKLHDLRYSQKTINHARHIHSLWCHANHHSPEDISGIIGDVTVATAHLIVSCRDLMTGDAYDQLVNAIENQILDLPGITEAIMEAQPCTGEGKHD